MGRLQDKVAIITGAGQGIGLAYAQRFLDEGAKVVVAEINAERAAGAMATLDGRGEAILVPTDISDEASAQACVDAAVEQFGTVHILVNNAALYYDIDNFDTSFDYLKKVFAVNQFGAWLMTRAAAPVMAKQHYGRIVNQSSGAAYAYTFPAFGDEFTGPSIQQVVDTVDRINRNDKTGERAVRIHYIGFPLDPQYPQFTNIRLAQLMRIICQRNGGSFVGLVR